MTPSNSAQPTIGPHYPPLDGLRGLSILLVIPHNADAFSQFAWWMLPPVVVFHSGWVGVQLFFALSGFLITANLLASRGAEHYFRSFYARRALRIFPLYYATLVFFLILLPRFARLPPAVIDSYANQGWFWSLLCNWPQAFGRSVYWFPHFWSLAIEEQFYLVWPWVVLACAPRRLFRLCVALIVASVVVRLAMLAFGASPDAIYRVTFCRMDALAAGALIAVLAHDPALATRLRQHPGRLLAATVAITAALALLTRGFAPSGLIMMSVGYSLLALAAAVALFVLVVSAGTPMARTLRVAMSAAWLRSVGRYSYAMYIFHLPLFIVLRDRLVALFQATGPLSPILVAASIVVISYGVAFASFHLWEKRFLALRRRFPPGRVPDAAGLPAPAADGR